MIQGLCSEQSPVACIPRVAVESGGRGVAGQTHVRRWPRTTRCNELAVIVMRDGEPEGRESLIAAVRPDICITWCRMSKKAGRGVAHRLDICVTLYSSIAGLTSCSRPSGGIYPEVLTAGETYAFLYK